MQINNVPASQTLTLSPGFIRCTQRHSLPWLLLGAILLIGDLAYQGALLWQLSEEQRIWESGQEAGQAAVRGQKYTRYSLFSAYDFEVIYNDAALHVYHRPLEFSTLQSRLDDQLEPKVKYDPDDPTKFAVSWGVSQRSERWRAIALFGSFWALVGGLLCWLGLRKLAPLRDARRCLSAPSWAALRIVSQRKKQKTTTFSYQTPTQRNEEIFVDDGALGPFLLEGNKLLALCHQKHPAYHIVLRADLYPLVMSKEEREGLATIFS
jgi:hypothetical protein